MNATGNTILITGGSAGIGLEIAKLFSAKGNHVIITGRNEKRLQAAAAQLKDVTAIVSDVSKEEDIAALAERLVKDFPQLNVVINNAGHAYAYTLNVNAGAAQKAAEEIQTNYLSIISLTERLLPHLLKQPAAAIVNVTSTVSFAPSMRTPTYSASKAALRAYTRILRYTLAQSSGIKVFELMPPLVNTGLSKDIGGANGIHPTVVAEDMLAAFENDTFEIMVGNTAKLYKVYLTSPDAALNALNSGSR